MSSNLKVHHIEGRERDCPGCHWPNLRRAITASWTAETSADERWSKRNPSLGQCAVTALVIQDAYGGELVRTTVGGVSHYYNRLPNGVELDLTRDQFDVWEPTPPETRERSYVLSYEPTAERYQLLLRAVLTRMGAAADSDDRHAFLRQIRDSQPLAGDPMSLHVVPVSFRDACAFVEGWHRHNKPPRGHKFSLGVAQNGTLVGVAMIGRPVARAYDDGLTLEVNRTATDGTPNANSMLYGAAWRATKALGYGRLITYTQADETGASLRAAGWRVVAELRNRRGWDAPSRPRDNGSYLSSERTLWEATA